MSEQNDLVFEKLTPFDSGDIRIYDKALDYVFAEEDITNVAISGAYGAGKSSVLETYKKAHPRMKFVHISLAHFQDSSKKAESDKPDDLIKESILEGKILNQLIHQIPASSIPQTDFRVKKSINRKRILWWSTIFFFLLMTILYSFHFEQWATYVNMLPDGMLYTCLRWTTSPLTRLVSWILCAACIYLCMYEIVKAQKSKNIFKRLNIQGNEIEILGESDDSYFDKYLNEVLYLFENVNAKAIVFEDMDRFDANRIFERLREVNTLANLERRQNKKEVLRFFYLLRDDIFISKDRTKFFDFIIPIVPVVDSSNSYDQFIDHLKRNGLFEKFSENFLQGLSLYVDDMRLLKNICNEFLIYYKRLNTTELDYNKMLALITYKNLFPRDFADLQLNKGFVYTLFSNKDLFIKTEKDRLLSRISDLEKTIQRAKDEMLVDKSELNDMYQYRREHYGWQARERLEEWHKQKYPQRIAQIENKNADKLAQLEDDLSLTKQELTSLEAKSLHDIITRDNIQFIFQTTSKTELGKEDNFESVKENDYFDLLKYLVRNGYIDETYADYMTYFYENSLSRIDKIFLRSVTDRKAKPYNYVLKSPAMVLRRLKPFDFDQEETLNYALCDHLLENHEHSEHLVHLIDQLRKTKNYSFVVQYFTLTSQLPAFVRAFNTQWPSLFDELLQEKVLTLNQLKDFSVYTLYYTSDECLGKINSSEKLSSHIAHTADYLNIQEPDIEKLIQRFKMLRISFHQIDFSSANMDLLLSVYNNNMYELNYDHLRLIMIHILNIRTPETIPHKSFTLLFENQESALFRRVNENLSEYMEVILSECSERIDDDETAVLYLLNSDDVKAEQKQRYIGFIHTPITSIISISDHALWESVVCSGALVYSEANIMDYFIHIEQIDNALVMFINKADQALDFSREDIEYDKKDKEALFRSIINCNDLNDSQYAQLLSTFGYHYEHFTFTGISDDKMRILIERHIIWMTPDSLLQIRENYPSVLYQFIKENIGTYTKILDNKIFSMTELLNILSWNIDDTLKITLLELTSDPISIIDKPYSSKVRLHILQNNLNQNDMDHLYLSYDKEPTEIRKIILDYAIERISEIVESITRVSAVLKEDIIRHTNVSQSNKVSMLAAMIPYLNQTEVCKYLTLLGLENFNNIFAYRARPKFKNNDHNILLLEAFKAKGWICEYLEDDVRDGYFKIHRKGIKKLDET